MFARITPLVSVQASGSVAAQTSSNIDISTWGNFTISAHAVTGNVSGTGSLYVTNIENDAHQPMLWQKLADVTTSGNNSGANSGITGTCYKWGQVRWEDSGTSASGSLITVTIAASDRGTK